MSLNKSNNNEQTKFTLVTAGLHGRILNDVDKIISPPKQVTARSKGSVNNNNNNNIPSQQGQHQQQQGKQKPKRPSSANPRTRVSHQHREPGKPQKNHPILSNPQQAAGPQKKSDVEYEGRNFSVLNREELLEELTEIKKQQRNNEAIIAQLRADNQRLESEVLKQQHRIDKLLSPQYSNNQHLVQEIRKDIEKSVLVRQLKAQMMTLRGTITEKETIIETLQKKTSTLNLIELTTEKEEYYYEIQRLKKIIAQKEKELQNEKSTHAWEKKGPITLEDNLRAEITRLSRGYQQVLERLETATIATNTNVTKPNSPRQSEIDNSKLNRPLSGKSPRGSDSTQTKNRPKSAGAKVPSISQNTNDVGYIDPILTTFDSKPSSSIKSNINQTSTSTKTNQIPSTNKSSNVKKDADFLYEMSEENVVGIGGESNVESYLTTSKGLSIPPTTPLPLGCKIQVKKRDNNIWEGRVIGYNEQKNTYDVQYDEGGREFDVLRSTITIVGEQISQTQPSSNSLPLSSTQSSSQPQPQTQQQINQQQTQQFNSNIKNSSPRKEAIIVKNKYQINDSVEGNYQGGGSWYPGIIIGIVDNKYRVRYQDGDEEGNVLEENIRLRENVNKSSVSVPISTPSLSTNITSTVKQSQPSDEKNDIPIYLPNDEIECRYRGKAKYYPGKIDAVNMDGTYDIYYHDGEYEKNVSHIYIKRSFDAMDKTQESPKLQSLNHNNNNNIDNNNGNGSDSPDQYAAQLDSPYPLYAVGNRIECKYKSGSKWYPGKISYVVNHGESYTIEYDDGTVEENVKPDNIKLKEVQYNIDSFLNDDEGDDIGGAAGLNTDDLLNDNYFTQLKTNQNQTTENITTNQKQYDPFEDDEEDNLNKTQNVIKQQLSSSSINSPKKNQPAVDINSFLAGFSDDDEGDDIIGGGLDGGDSIHVDYGVCPDPKVGEENDHDELNQTDDYGEDFDD